MVGWKAPSGTGSIVKRLIVPTAIALVFAALPALASSSATLLPNGTPIDVTLDAPFDGTEYVVPSISGTVDDTPIAQALMSTSCEP